MGLAGRNEPAVPSAAVRLGRLGSGGSARRRCRPAESAGRTAGPFQRTPPPPSPKHPQVRHPFFSPTFTHWGPRMQGS